MKKQKTKKILAILLAVSLLMPMLPILPGMSTTVYGSEPKVTQFATKDQLTTNFNLDGGTVGKIKFGANSRIWYIAGKDPDTKNGGLVLMCDPASPLATDQQFSSVDTKGQSYNEAWGCTYDSLSVPTTVNLNHYGGSDLRAALKALETNTAYFSPSEQGLMQETTITTNDTKKQTTYTTADKLYAAYGNLTYPSSLYITVGTNAAGSLHGGLKINLTGNSNSPYADDRNSPFWLRTPQNVSPYFALIAYPGSYADNEDVINALAVVPAFNLNLSSVLFASAAQAASSDGTLTIEDAMTLRYMPAAGTSLGTAAINPAQNSVSVNSASIGTYLVVQNGSGAWAQKVTGNASVSAADVTIGGSKLTSFADCKVWLEKTNIDDRITTAVMAVQEYEVNITNPSDSHITRSTAGGNGEETQIVAAGTAITDVVYTADSGYYFPVNYSVTKDNGISVTQNSPTQITVSGTPTADAEITLTAATEKSGQTAPVGLSDGIGKINGTQIAMEYAAAADATEWEPCTEGTTGVEAGTWYVRYKETDTKKASPATVITVTAPSYTITTDPAVLNFDSVNLDENGSYIQPKEKTVTVKNTGNSEVTLTKPASTSYTIGDLSKATLNAEESATFTVQPNANLTAGTYSETLEVTTDKGPKAMVTLSFTVNEAFSVTIDPASAEIIAGQSQTLTAEPKGGSGSYTYAWYAESEANVIGSENKISVPPTTTTTYKVVVTDTIEKKDATATVTVIPATYTITTDPAALNFDSVNLNAEGSYIQPETQTVTVENKGNSTVTLTKPDSTSYTIGELTKDTLDAGDTATFTVQPNANLTAGTYSETLKVTTDKGTEAEVTVNFTVKEKPEDAPKIINGKSTKVPQTGDNSNLALWLILLVLSCGGLTIPGIRKRHKKIR